MKPICVKCQRFYRPKQNGVMFTEMMPIGGAGINPPGTEAPEQWTPYKIWRGDLWHCLGCGHELISGVAYDPISEHYMPQFQETAEALGADKIKINDC